MPTKKPIRKPVSGAKKGKPVATKSHIQAKAAVRRKAVAQGVLAGKTEKQIAKEIGTTRDSIATAKEHPEFARTLAEQLARHQAKLDDLFEDSLAALKELMASPNQASTRFGAIDRLLKIYEIVQPKEVSAIGGNSIQYNHLTTIVSQYREGRT